MVYLPNEIFTNIINFTAHTHLQRHRKIMKTIIPDIDLFLDLYGTILRDKLDLSKQHSIDWHFKVRRHSPRTFESFIDYHEYDSDSEEFDYDFTRINKFIFDGNLIYREMD